MKPAQRSLTVEEARARILAAIPRLPAETVALADAAGRVLAEDVRAPENLWPFPRAAMDGVAARADDIAGAAVSAPVVLRVRGDLFAGGVWPGEVAPGEAVRIATGSPMPAGADVVIPREVLEERDGHVVVRQPLPRARHVFPAGEDARAGETVLRAGTVLHGGHIGLLAAVGCPHVPVVRRPVVALLATGDELVPPHAPLRPGAVRESNTSALAAEVVGVGGVPRVLGVVADEPASVLVAIRRGLADDALVVCGGVSVGDRDLVRGALREAGVDLAFEGVAMKPGAPATFGRAGGTPVFALPGTPGAARVAFEMLVRPALAAMAGRRIVDRPRVRAILDAPLQTTGGRRRFLWARATVRASGVRVVPLAGQGTATLRSASDANALIDLSAHESALPAGAAVVVHLLATDDLPCTPDRPAAVAVVGARDVGKTGVMEGLIAALASRGLRVGAVKHHVHLDLPEPAAVDTARFARAGAAVTVLAGPPGFVRRLGPPPVPSAPAGRGLPDAGAETPLDTVLATVGDVDLVLVEGYARSSLPKVLVVRRGVAADRPPPAPPIVAVIGDADAMAAAEREAAVGARQFPWGAMAALADLVASWSGHGAPA